MSTRERIISMVEYLSPEQLEAIALLLSTMVNQSAAKEERNAEYLAMIDEGLAQIEEGTCQPHDLIEVEDDGEALDG